MDLSQRYKQAAKEARWALGFSYFLCNWMVCLCLFTERLAWTDRFSVMV
jgi:uncharacterized membrane protein YhdT